MDLAKRIESARLTFFLAALIGCSPGSEPSVGLSVSEVDSAGMALVTITGDVTDLPLWTLASEPDALISGEAAPYLGSIGEVEFLSDGSFLVEDNQTDELRLFDASGELRRLVGGAGEGPGEFQNITELTVTPGHTAYTYDRRLYRISGFDRAGDLIGTIGLTRENGGYGTLAMDAWAFDSQRLVLYRLSPYDTADTSPLPRRDKRDVVLFAFDGNGEVIAEPVRFPGGYSVEFEEGDTRVFGRSFRTSRGAWSKHPSRRTSCRRCDRRSVESLSMRLVGSGCRDSARRRTRGSRKTHGTSWMPMAIRWPA